MRFRRGNALPLHKWVDREAAFKVAERLYGSDDVRQRYTGLRVMARLDHERALPYLERSALHDDGALRARAVRQLSDRLDRAQWPIFVEVVRAGSSDAHVAFRALKRLATPQDGPALQQLSTAVGGVHRRNLRKLLRRLEAT